MALQTFPAARQGKLLLIGVLGLGLAACASNERPEADVAASQVTAIGVNSYLWRATLETFQFAGTSSEDPLTGVVVTKWYSPPSKPSERLRVSVFILSRALRSDSLAVTVERQVRSPAGDWSDEPISREAVADLENAVLLRARQIHAERYRNTMYN